MALAFGLLLPMPLVWAFYVVTYGPLFQTKPEVRASPMLTADAHRSLVTYAHDCQRREECEPPLECLFNPRVLSSYCTDSRCVTDKHCEDGATCRLVPTRGGGLPVGLCVLEGVRQEGEECSRVPTRREDGCSQDLLCEQWCGRSCRMDEPGSCPAGFFCQERDRVGGASCLPTCEGRSCPEGQQCIQMNEHVSVCAQVHGQYCQQNGCSEGQECQHRSYPRRPGEVWMDCFFRCGKDKPPCPEGHVCDVLECRKSCDPQVEGACGPHLRCQRYSDTSPWMCLPDV